MIPDALTQFLDRGGPTLWLISALSVLTVALILWKVWRLALVGAWSGSATAQAVALWADGQAEPALATVAGRRSLRARLAHAAMSACLDATLTEAQAREETERRARADLGQARSGLRALELIAAIAPLLGLLGTVLGMIAAFQTLQEAGARADPSALAGGIWEALLTTAAGMAVAIPAGVALTWFESVTDRLQADMEDTATRIFLRRGRG
jgi:biopolymer transport protein ExbB